jgi:alkylation response protein AidB-like acyl-CoA dehydrogenase
VHNQGVLHIGPVIIKYGTPKQKAFYLPRILSFEDYWAQGFSEPGAGSDLASLRTRAIRDGDHYVINGSKIWTTHAHFSNRLFALVRTSDTGRKQEGISFLLMDLDTPGITIRPIVSIEGGTGLNEVFLEDVRVPRDSLVGEAGMGWTYAKYLLEKERTTSAFLYSNKRELEKARAIAQRETVGGVPLIATPEFAARLARVEVDVLALEYSVLRVLSNERNRQNLEAVVSALKLRGSALQQRVTELQLDALGLRSLRQWARDEGEAIEGDEAARWPTHVPGRTAQALISRASTIYGGSQEIQKNIIAKLAFGL